MKPFLFPYLCYVQANFAKACVPGINYNLHPKKRTWYSLHPRGANVLCEISFDSRIIGAVNAIRCQVHKTDQAPGTAVA